MRLGRAFFAGERPSLFHRPCVTNIVNFRAFVNNFGNISLTGGLVAREEVLGLVQRVLRDGPFSMRQLAEDARLSYGVLRAWAMGRRTPTPENLSRIADGFERRVERLHGIITELRRAAGEHSENQ